MIRLRNYSVSTRLGFGLGLIMAIMIFVVVMAIMNIQFNIKRLDKIISYNNKKVIFANMINNCQGPSYFPTPRSTVIPHFCHRSLYRD